VVEDTRDRRQERAVEPDQVSALPSKCRLSNENVYTPFSFSSFNPVGFEGGAYPLYRKARKYGFSNKM